MSTCTDEADNAPLHMQEALSPVSFKLFIINKKDSFDFKWLFNPNNSERRVCSSES